MIHWGLSREYKIGLTFKNQAKKFIILANLKGEAM